MEKVEEFFRAIENVYSYRYHKNGGTKTMTQMWCSQLENS